MDNKAELIQNIQKNAKLVLTSTDKATTIKDQEKLAMLGVVCYLAIKHFGLENMPVNFLYALSLAIGETVAMLTGKETADVLVGKLPNDE